MIINLLDGVAIAGLLFLLAVGLTVIFGLVDVLNLAHGAFYMVGGYLALALTSGKAPSLLGLVLITLVMVLVGAALGLLLNVALKPLGRADHLTQALLTLGLSMIISEVTLQVAGRSFRSLLVTDSLAGSVRIGSGEFPLYRLAVIAVSLILGTLVYWVFERTKLGSVTRAAIDDPAILGTIGYNVPRVKTGVIMAGSALATVAGVLGAPLLNLRPGLDTEVLNLALIVVVIGGLGSIKGVAVGSLLIGVLQTLGNAYFPAFASYLLFGLMLIVLLARPQGLFGRTP